MIEKKSNAYFVIYQKEIQKPRVVWVATNQNFICRQIAEKLFNYSRFVIKLGGQKDKSK